MNDMLEKLTHLRDELKALTVEVHADDMDADIGFIANIVKKLPSGRMRAVSAYVQENLATRVRNKFKKPGGKNAEAYIRNTVFLIHEATRTIGYRVINSGKDSHLLSIAVLTPIKTPKGTIYVIDGGASDKFDCLTAHFFDRYAERVIRGTRLNRKEAIDDWLKKFVEEPSQQVEAIKNKDGSVDVFDAHPEGLGLGLMQEGHGVNIVLLKTFISNSMLTARQMSIGELVDKKMKFTGK